METAGVKLVDATGGVERDWRALVSITAENSLWLQPTAQPLRDSGWILVLHATFIDLADDIPRAGLRSSRWCQAMREGLNYLGHVDRREDTNAEV